MGDEMRVSLGALMAWVGNALCGCRETASPLVCRSWGCALESLLFRSLVIRWYPQKPLTRVFNPFTRGEVTNGLLETEVSQEDID